MKNNTKWYICNKKETFSMKPLKTKVSITLDENVIAIIRKMADEDDRNFSQYINLILKEWISSHTDTNTTK